MQALPHQWRPLLTRGRMGHERKDWLRTPSSLFGLLFWVFGRSKITNQNCLPDSCERQQAWNSLGHGARNHMSCLCSTCPWYACKQIHNWNYTSAPLDPVHGYGSISTPLVTAHVTLLFKEQTHEQLHFQRQKNTYYSDYHKFFFVMMSINALIAQISLLWIPLEWTVRVKYVQWVLPDLACSNYLTKEGNHEEHSAGWKGCQSDLAMELHNTYAKLASFARMPSLHKFLKQNQSFAVLQQLERLNLRFVRIESCCYFPLACKLYADYSTQEGVLHSWASNPACKKVGLNLQHFPRQALRQIAEAQKWCLDGLYCKSERRFV